MDFLPLSSNQPTRECYPDRHPGHTLILVAAHRDPPPNLPPRFMVLHRHAVIITLPTPSDVGLPEVEVHRH